MIKQPHEKSIKSLYNHLKASASKRNIHFELSLNDLNNLTFPISCPILNIPLYFNSGNQQDNSYSIDRIDSSKGYTIDNIIVISSRANKLKSDATIVELEAIVNFYKSVTI